MPWLDDLIFAERIMSRLVEVTSILPVAKQAKLARFWYEMSSENTLRRILHCLQETITFYVHSSEYTITSQDASPYVYAVKTMKVNKTSH